MLSVLLKAQVSLRHVVFGPRAGIDAFFSEGTPYQGGYFRVKFEFTEEFPAAPPKCTAALSRNYCPPVLISL